MDINGHESNAAVGTLAVLCSPPTSSISVRANDAMRPRWRQCEHVATQRFIAIPLTCSFCVACRACQFIDSTIFQHSYRPPNPMEAHLPGDWTTKCWQLKKKILRKYSAFDWVFDWERKKCKKWKLIEMPIPFKVIFARYSFCCFIFCGHN